MDLCYEFAFMHKTIAIAQSLMNVYIYIYIYIYEIKRVTVRTAGDQNQETIFAVFQPLVN